MNITEYIEKNPANRYLLLLDNKAEIIEGEIDIELLNDIFLSEDVIAKTAMAISFNNIDFCDKMIKHLEQIKSFHLKEE